MSFPQTATTLKSVSFSAVYNELTPFLLHAYKIMLLYNTYIFMYSFELLFYR